MRLQASLLNQGALKIPFVYLDGKEYSECEHTAPTALKRRVKKQYLEDVSQKKVKCRREQECLEQ